MIKGKILDLIHRDVDGAIEEGEKSELNRYLLKNAEAQKLYHNLNKTMNVLRKIEDIEPPSDLKQSIMNSIDSNLYTKVKIEEKYKWKILHWLVNPKPRLAYAFAIGLIFGVLVTALWRQDRINSSSSDISDFYGTIRLSEKAEVKKLNEFLIDMPQVSGSVKVHRLNNLLWFEIDLRSSENFKYLCEYNPEEFSFLSYLPLEFNKNILETSKNTLAVSGGGNSQFRLSFAEIKDPTTSINLRLFVAGNTVFNQQIFIKSIDK